MSQDNITPEEPRQENRPTAGARKRPRKKVRSAFVNWLFTHGLLLAAAVPAFVIGLGAATMAMAVHLNRDYRPAQYSMKAYSRSQSKDYEAAKVCFERLLRLNAGSDKVKFGLAQVYEKLGQKERALDTISKLAPLDQSGFAPAHLVMAVFLLSRRDLPEGAVLNAETHLKHVLESTPDSYDARSLLSQIYMRTGRNQEAKIELSQIVQEHPEHLLQLAAIERTMGNETEASTAAEKALKTYTQRTLEEPSNLNHRVLAAGAAAFLKQFPKSESILLDALAKGENADLHSTLAGLYLIWADDLMKDSKNGPATWIPLLERGIRHQPNNPLLIDRFLTLMSKNGQDTDETRTALMDMLSDGRAPASAHFLLGVDAWRRQKTEEARFHWERAHELAPQLVGATNNLAWALATGPNPDLPRSLELIELALDRSPKNPTYLGTRGRVLVRMERWKEAISNLEDALAATPDDSDIHADLATAYRALGMGELADRHQAQVKNQQPTASAQP